MKIYQRSLDQCEFRDLELKQGYFLNRSQPITPSMTIKATMDNAFENLINQTNLEFNSQSDVLRATQNVTLSQSNSPLNDNNSPLNNYYENMLSQNSSLISISQKDISVSSKAFDHVVEVAAEEDEFKEFKVPANKPKKKKGFGKFLMENDMMYTTVDSTQRNKVRFVPEVDLN